MRNYKALASLLSVILLLGMSTLSEARVGGGRSSGYRGSRSLSTGTSRSYNYNPGNTTARPVYGAQHPTQPTSPLGAAPQSSFMRNLAGGVAGGFIGSMLFRSLGYGGSNAGMPGYGGGSAGGIGLFEILLLAGLGFVLYRMYARRQEATQGEMGAVYPFAAPAVTRADPRPVDEQELAQQLHQMDGSFELSRFKEQRMDDFLKIQSAWNSRNLEEVRNLIAPALYGVLDSDIADLKRAHHINKLENIAVRGSELTEAWEEDGNEYATLQFRAQLLDYTIDENTQAIVDGDRQQPVKFEEEWTFVKKASSGSYGSPWTLTAISN